MRLILTFLAVGIFCAALGFAAIMALYLYYARDLPDPNALSRRQLFQTARILDRQGRLLQEINDPTGGRRIVVHLSDATKGMPDAPTAPEAASFSGNPRFHRPRAVPPT